MQYLFGILMAVSAALLILLILVQRGRGGGLTGALGGMGGQSAFGTKAGDLFTRVTMIVATVWILTSVAAIAVLNTSRSTKFGNAPSVNRSAVPAVKATSDATGKEAPSANDAPPPVNPEAPLGTPPVNSPSN